MKITDEMIEAAKRAIYACHPDCYRKKKWLTTIDPAFEIIEEAIPYEEASQSNLDMCEKEAKAALEAALQTKLTEQDKLLEVMGEALDIANRCIENGDLILVGSAYHSIIKEELAQYQSYKAGRE